MRKGILGCVFALLITSSASAQHLTDMWVGQTEDGQLALGGVSLDLPIVLAPVDGVITGWSGANPGFDNVQPGSETLKPLAEGSLIWVDLVSISPGLAMIDNDQQLHTHDGSVYCGDEHLHVHYTWLIDSTSSEFDSMQTLWSVELRLRDESGQQATSKTYRVMFQNEECTLPGDIDNDGEVTDMDLDVIYSIIIDPASVTHYERCAADLNLDGFATMADEQILLNELDLEETPVRGDANGDTVLDMSDAVSLLTHLFLGGYEPATRVHANANGDSLVDMADAIYVMNYRFLGGSPPPAPFK